MNEQKATARLLKAIFGEHEITINKELQRLRLIRALSYRELGSILKVSFTYIADVEKGRRTPSCELVEKYCKELELGEQEQQYLCALYLKSKVQHIKMPFNRKVEFNIKAKEK